MQLIVMTSEDWQEVVGLLGAVLLAITNGAPAVPTPAPIHTDNPKYGAFMDVVKLLKPMMNTSADPCNDFYAFTCGNFNGDMSFDVSDNENSIKMARQFKKQYYLDVAPQPVNQAAWYFQQCRQANMNWNSVANGAPTVSALNDMLSMTGVPFPALNQSINNISPLTPTQLGTMIGYLAGSEGVYTLLSPFVDTNWKDPTGPQGYGLFIDQPTTIYRSTYYTKAWDLIRSNYVATVQKNLQKVAAAMNMNALNPTKLKSDAEALVDFEFNLATQYSTDDTTRRKYQRSYNPMTRTNATTAYSFIDWRTFLAHARERNLTNSTDNKLLK
ncbi:unnamed protein product, partial [Mesorhabditis belari]|uniref:Peptidase M13 N-terminal domain-containing protein n=1 Tax=Mesorhabditis belari TaxID=2138241 RepID=A0AAF3FN68_9BILA